VKRKRNKQGDAGGSQGFQGELELVVSGGQKAWGTGAPHPRILLVGTAAPLYEKKVLRTVGLGIRGSTQPICVGLYGLITFVLFSVCSLAARADAPATPITTWAVRVADDSRCRESQSFAATLAAQIPFAQRTTVDQAELLAEVTLLSGGVARVRVWDRILQAEAGARELQLGPGSCDDNAEALALVIGVLVEAGRGAPPQPPPPPLPPPPPPPPPSRPPPPPEPAPKPVRHAWLGPRAGYDLNVAVGIGAGLLPGPAPLLTVGWGIRGTKAWPFWLEGTASTRDTADVKYLTGYASLLTCPLSGTWRTIRGRACAGGSFGLIRAEGQGSLSNAWQEKRRLLLVGVELAASVPIVGPLEFTLLGRVDLVPIRQKFLYELRDMTEQTLYEVKIFTGSLFAGLALRFR
jgi:hypothetical protein